MTDTIKEEDLIRKEDLTPETSQEVETIETETSEQDPLKTELERVQQTGRTEKEKAEFTLRKNAERVKALGGDPTSILGIEKEVDIEDEDDKPVTLGMLKKMQQETASKTALQLAEEISNETERELAKWHLQNTIKSTGNPAKDFELSLSLVNAVKNKQILEEIGRKGPAKTHSSGSSAPAKTEGNEIELTKDELAFMNPPFNLSKEEILKARKK